MPSSPADRAGALPPRLLPILYFAFAHLSLGLAFAAVALDARAVAGFFYHARLVAIVHLVTLGWITCSILGAVYVVGPMALRMRLPARRADYVAYASTTIGIAGMVSHFWIEQVSGMAYSALMVTLGVLYVVVRLLGALRRAPIPVAVRLHLAFAGLNVIGAATMGVLLGFDKALHYLPGFVLSNVFAHAHLAAIGWASMMVVGVGYRLLPMVLPSAMPEGRSVMASAILLEAGAVGLFVTFLARSALVAVFATVTAAGFAAFLLHVRWMKRHLRPAPPGLARPDYAAWHAIVALGSLAIAAALGLVLAWRAPSELTLRLALAYGVFGLVGFLGQMVVGMAHRVLPLFAWYWAFANSGDAGPVPSPHEMPVRWLQRAAFFLWLAGVPLVAAGLFVDRVTPLAAGAWLLLGASVAGSVNTAIVLRHAYRGRD